MARPESVFDRADPFTGQSAWANWAQSVNPLGVSPGGSFSDWAPATLYDYGNAPDLGSYSPSYTAGRDQTYYGADSVDYGASLISGGIDAYLKQAHPELYSGFQNYGTSTNAGLVSNPATPKWANVNKWNDQILSAVQKVYNDTGVYVPPNVVKSIMQIESQGNPASGPAAGLMQVTSGAMGQYDLAKAVSDPAYGIWAGVNELALRYKDGKAIADANKSPFDWSNAATGYFSGHYYPTGANDYAAGGGSTDYQYQKAFNDNFAELSQAATQSGQTGGQAAPNTKAFNAIWGGFDAPITQGMGWTDFAQNSDYAKTAYQYTADYTRDHQPMGHAGIDVGVSYGSRLYTPVAGKVTLAGGTGYYCDADGNGCGPGVGELAITYPNGDVLILGHMSQIAVKAGDTVQPGQFVGYSGSENGAHVHVEYRKHLGPPGTGTTSGYEVQDPSLALSGIFTGAYGSAPGNGPAVAASPNNWTQFMVNALKGLPLTGTAPGEGGFHDWMLNTLQGKPVIEQPGGKPTYLWSMTPTMTPPDAGNAATGGGGFG